jgi:TonB family protein
MYAQTKSSLLLFVAAGVLSVTHPACAANREVDAYLQRASDTATARLAAEGVQVPTGLRVKARVDSDGRLTALRIVTSSGSLETDQKAATALRRLRVAQPPLVLIGADVNVAVGPEPLVTAKAP